MFWGTVLDNILYMLESTLRFDGKYTVPSAAMLSTNFICIECFLYEYLCIKVFSNHVMLLRSRFLRYIVGDKMNNDFGALVE
jgi:hypothetical protein